MPDADEDVELRALQHKAYGRDGELSDAEAARLRELELVRDATDQQTPVNPQDRTAAVTEESRSAIALGTDSQESGRIERAEAEAADSAVGVPTSGPEGAGSDSARHALRKHWKAAAAASVLLLVLGAGAEWALFGRGEGIALTAEQQQRRLDLESQRDFDAGTVRAVGKDDDALVWYGTKNDAKVACIVLDVGDESADSCQPIDDLSNGSGLSAAVLQTSEDAEAMQVYATALRTTTGEITAIVQRHPMQTESWIDQFTGYEADRAQELMDQGYEPFSYSIVGYFRGAPVWSATKFEGDTTQQCLVVDVVDATACTPSHLLGGSPIAVHGTDSDGDGGGGSWTVELGTTSNGTNYLTISGDGDLASVRPGEQISVDDGSVLELGGEYGDPITVTPDDPEN